MVTLFSARLPFHPVLVGFIGDRDGPGVSIESQRHFASFVGALLSSALLSVARPERAFAFRFAEEVHE